MGKKDIVLKKYLSTPEIFADLFNGTVFGGRQVLKGDSLSELDSTETSVLHLAGDGVEAGQKFRDIIKRAADGTRLLILGIENQMQIDYAMVIRSQLYDALNYMDQVADKKREHARANDLTGAERLSGFTREDKLNAVLTLVLYYGEEDWNGPTELYDILGDGIRSLQLDEYLNNYKINLIQMRRIEEPERFHSGLRQICEILKLGSSKRKVREFFKSGREAYSDLDEETLDVIRTLLEIPGLKVERGNGEVRKGGRNMNAFAEFYEEVKTEMFKEGLEQGSEQVARLFSMLMADGRYEDMERAGKDAEYRNELIRQYGL